MPYRRIPSLNWLRVFEAAARMESFSGAARLLNMSPAAVSQQIKALETHLRTQLFERGARHVTLTNAGLSFLPAVRQALVSMETTAASLFGHAQSSSVTLQANLIFATSWLVPRLRDFERDNPDIQLHIMAGHNESDLNRVGPDLYVIFGSVPRSWGDSDLLFGETIYPVAAAPTAARVAAPSQLLDHRLIEISNHRTGWLQLFETFDSFELAEARFCFADTSEVALAMAAADYGIALARAPATDGHVRGYGLKRCLGGVEVEGSESYHLVCRSRASLSPSARRLRSWLLDVTSKHR